MSDNVQGMPKATASTISTLPNALLKRTEASPVHTGGSILITSTPANLPFEFAQTPHASVSLTAGGFAKRVLDLGVALFGGIAITPILLLIAVLIKLDSSGPVLFKQKRVGLNGKVFWMYKFRSMQVDAETRQQELLHLNEMDGPLFKIKKDPRVTRLGRWLRRTSFDEFPQLLNVLKGEMSLVGPRPPLPSEVQSFQPTHLTKFQVRPGMTGLWQVSGRNEVSAFQQMVTLDREYVRGWSFSFDVLILLRTFKAVLWGIGAS